MRLPLLAVAALAFLRIVVGLHFFLEGLSHLRDPSWSSAGFRKAAVGPLADPLQSLLPQTGAWSTTLGRGDGRPAAEAAAAWQASVVEGWRRLLDDRTRAVPLDAAGRAAAEERLAAAADELRDHVAGLGEDLAEHRRQLERLAGLERRPEATAIPFERARVVKKRAELAGQAAGWMADADAIGRKLVADWDAALPSPEARRAAAAAARPSALWRADRFVSWSLTTIGACLLAGLFVKFNAMGGAIFLASVGAAQPFWVAGAQPTYDQWVELAALLVLAALPVGGWSGLDHFLVRWCSVCRRLNGGDPGTCAR
ncbi:MAG: hypothetical protein ACKON7_12875 [Planctomycetaceae bacterium]